MELAASELFLNKFTYIVRTYEERLIVLHGEVLFNCLNNAY